MRRGQLASLGLVHESVGAAAKEDGTGIHRTGVCGPHHGSQQGVPALSQGT